MSTTQSIISVGGIAQTVGFPVSDVLKAAAALSIAPEIKIDRVPHFDERAVKRIETWLYNQKRNT
jgi:hypothetical protein